MQKRFSSKAPTKQEAEGDTDTPKTDSKLSPAQKPELSVAGRHILHLFTKVEGRFLLFVGTLSIHITAKLVDLIMGVLFPKFDQDS